MPLAARARVRDDRTVIDFWCELASPYTYLAACRISVPMRWRPFALGPIFAAQGWATSPFVIYEAKGRYMWRDVEREAEAHGIPWRRPSVFPRNSVPAAKLAHGLSDDDRPRFVRRVLEANFVEDREIGEASVLAEITADLGVSPVDVSGALRRETEEAIRLGIFGAPMFSVDGELFWGNDRLERAVAWAARETPR